MKTIVSALLALSVLAVAATAPARADYFLWRPPLQRQGVLRVSEEHQRLNQAADRDRRLWRRSMPNPVA